MAKSLPLWLLQTGHALSVRGAARQQAHAFQQPQQVQLARWRRLMQANQASAYGRAHGFAGISTIKQYQDRVPVVDYDALSPWIDSIAAGEQQVLTQAPVRMLEPSGGSTATNKFIPYTDDLLADFAWATNPWLFDLLSNVKGLKGTQSYWSISLAKQGRRLTDGGVPIGFDDDTEYFGPLMRWALGKAMAVPNSVSKAPDMDTWRRQTVLHLLMSESLGLISVWSPTFLSLLMAYIHQNLEDLLRELPIRRVSQIKHGMFKEGRFCGEALWPELRLISCWTDSIASHFLPELTQWFTRTPIQGKGLLATEGVVSTPLLSEEGAGCPLAIGSHFLEFIDLDHPARTPMLAHELRPGGAYSPVLSTGGGFYRYHLKDVVRCVGKVGLTPSVRFEGKLDRVSDLVGEKVHANQVEEALAMAKGVTGADIRFALLAPIRQATPHYRLFLETDALPGVQARVAELVESFLAGGHHYRTCRRLGQLSPVQVHLVRDGWRTYERTLIAAGQRGGDIKPTALDARHDWLKVFDKG